MNVKVYAFSISTNEQFDDVIKGAEKSNRLLEVFKQYPFDFVGVHPDPNGQFAAFLFRTPKGRNEAAKKAQEIGFETAAPMLNTAYVDEKYIKGGMQ